MTSPVFDFKSIRRSLERQEQKADFEEKNSQTDLSKVVWTPEWGYGAAVPYENLVPYPFTQVAIELLSELAHPTVILDDPCKLAVTDLA
jgi:hypothetical protein